jgi:mono/diheme cytochrome c family protein
MTARSCLPLLVLALLAAPAPAAPEPVEYNRDVRPILADHCFACHGPDKNTRKAGLRLDTPEGATGPREGGPVVVPGKPADSELVKRIGHDDLKQRMPPAKFGKPLTPAEIAVLTRWVEQGAKYQDHWSRLPVRRPPLPEVRGKEWVRNPIDAFVLARLEKEGLKPSPEADRRTLLRRLSFDLTGLPPTPEEVDAFLADNSSDAYEKQVDRLLASPHYGERMTVFWLDLVRYADTNGYHGDNHHDIALYRDYVINSFNANKRFDQFTVEQLAGDLLPDATLEQKIASGYNRLLMVTREGGAQAREYQAKYAADRVRNASVVWLGATLGCCECHDHKFDPFAQKDFYRFAAFFADIQEVAVGEQPPFLLPTEEQKKQLADLDARLALAGKVLAAEPALGPLVGVRKEQAGLQARRNAVVAQVPKTLISVSGTPRTMRVLPRGNWLDESGEIVEPGTPASLPPLGVSGRRATRLDLARWLTTKEHPLTARVFVNRAWALFYGRGLVTTMDDLGSQGAWPTHPELLDFLAAEFVDGGWDVKRLVRLLVTSSAYRQASRADERLRQRDPYNALLARQDRHRLDAEMVRDNALAVSGLLKDRVGGPSVKPYQPRGYWAYLNFPTREWENGHGDDLYRRGLYTYWCRTFLHPGMRAFDAPSREEACVERPRSNTPQQALVLLNDPVFVEAARALAERGLRDGGKDDGERIAYLFRRALQRKPTPEEAGVLTALLEKHRTQYRADKKAAGELLHTGERPVPPDLDAAELAAWTSVCRVLLNLHETITRN